MGGVVSAVQQRGPTCAGNERGGRAGTPPELRNWRPMRVGRGRCFSNRATSAARECTQGQRTPIPARLGGECAVRALALPPARPAVWPRLRGRVGGNASRAAARAVKVLWQREGWVGGVVSAVQQRGPTCAGNERGTNNRVTSAAMRPLARVGSRQSAGQKSLVFRILRRLAASAPLERLDSPTRPPCGLAPLLGLGANAPPSCNAGRQLALGPPGRVGGVLQGVQQRGPACAGSNTCLNDTGTKMGKAVFLMRGAGVIAPFGSR